MRRRGSGGAPDDRRKLSLPWLEMFWIVRRTDEREKCVDSRFRPVNLQGTDKFKGTEEDAYNQTQLDRRQNDASAVEGCLHSKSSEQEVSSHGWSRAYFEPDEVDES